MQGGRRRNCLARGTFTKTRAKGQSYSAWNATLNGVFGVLPVHPVWLWQRTTSQVPAKSLSECKCCRRPNDRSFRQLSSWSRTGVCHIQHRCRDACITSQLTERSRGRGKHAGRRRVPAPLASRGAEPQREGSVLTLPSWGRGPGQGRRPKSRGRRPVTVRSKAYARTRGTPGASPQRLCPERLEP